MRHLILTVAVATLMAMTARATVLIPTDLATLSRTATVIARGQVVAVDARWTDDRRTIETLVTLQTETYLKGPLSETLQFRVPGGMLGRFRNIVVGAPTFAVGDRVVVFLGAHGPTIPFVLGLGQGVYRIGVTSAGASMVSPPPIDGDTIGPIVRGTATRVPASLADFEHQVRQFTGVAQ
jgi:hypothetical protein